MRLFVISAFAAILAVPFTFSQEPAKGKAKDDVRDLWYRHGPNFFGYNGHVKARSDQYESWKIDSAKVTQIIDGKNMIVMMRIDRELETWWMTAFDTEGLVDGKTYKLGNVVKVGTKQYKTVLGGTKTVSLAIPKPVYDQGITLEEFKQVLAAGLPLGPDWVEWLKEKEAKEAKDAVKAAKESADRAAAAERKRIAEAEIRKDAEALAAILAKKAAAQAEIDKKEKYEADAATKLRLAKSQLADGRAKMASDSSAAQREGKKLVEFGLARLRKMIEEYPRSAAVVEARELLAAEEAKK